MPIEPTRHTRTSLVDQFGMDLGNLIETDRDRQAEAMQGELRDYVGNAINKQHRFTLEELMANPRFANMLNSLLSSRMDMVLRADEMEGSPSDYGYIYLPEYGEWARGTMKDAKKSKSPWYKTSREVLDAIYDDALVGDNGASAAGFSRGDLYSYAANKLQGLVNSAIGGGDDVKQKLLDGGILDKDSFEKNIYKVRPWEEHSAGYNIASFLLPMRTIGLMNDPELRANASAGDYAKALGIDVLEGALSLLNPIGKGASLALRAGAKAAGKTGALSRMFSKAVNSPMLNNVMEGGIGNVGNYVVGHGADELLDTENAYQSKEMNATDAAIAAATGAVPPFLEQLGKGLFRKSMQGSGVPLMGKKDQARKAIAESLGIGIEDVDNGLVKELIDPKNTWGEFLEKPFKDLSTTYPNAGTLRVPRSKLDEDLYIENAKQQVIDQLPPPLRSKFEDYAMYNPKEFHELLKGTHPHLNTNATSTETYSEPWKAYAYSAPESPQFYKSGFSIPLKDKETLAGLGHDEWMKRYEIGQRAKADYNTRRKIHDATTGTSNNNWNVAPWSPRNGDIVKTLGGANPGNAYMSKGANVFLRQMGLNDQSSLLFPENPTKAVRGGVPTRKRKEAR